MTVRSRVDGELVRVLFQEGQLVKEGELLAEIDPRAFQVQLAQAEGQLARDRALLENAKLDLERYRTLFKQDSIAKQQVDTQQSLVRQYDGAIAVDRSQVDNAKLQLAYSRITAPISGRIGLRQVDAGNIVRSGDQNGIVVITQLQPVTVLYTVPPMAATLSGPRRKPWDSRFRFYLVKMKPGSPLKEHSRAFPRQTVLWPISAAAVSIW